MNKIALFGAGALMLGMTSCLGNDDDVKSEVTYNVPTYAVATDSKGATTVSNGVLVTFGMDNVKYNTTVKISNLNLGGQATTLTTARIPFRMGVYQMPGNTVAQFCLVEASDATGEGGSITGFNADMTMCANTMNQQVLKDLNQQLTLDPIVYPGQQPNSSWYTSIQFKTGDYDVMTFWNDMLYTGDGTVMAPDMTMFTDKSGVIRVKLALANAGDYKANIYFYNYKFKEGQEETENFVFTDVPVTFGSNGFTINAADVTPVTLDDKKAMDTYKMGKLEVRSTRKMTSIECHFELADKSAGSFQGTGLYEFNLSDVKQ